MTQWLSDLLMTFAGYSEIHSTLLWRLFQTLFVLGHDITDGF